MRIDMVTIFPEMFSGPFGDSITKRAVDNGILDIHFTNFRDFAEDKHHHVDDSPFGGSPLLNCLTVRDEDGIRALCADLGQPSGVSWTYGEGNGEP